MKLKRINQPDILSHAQNHHKHSHRSASSDLTLPPEFSIFNKNDRHSMDLKMLKEKLMCRNQRKNQTVVQNEDTLKIIALYQKLKCLYKKLSSLYPTNEHKLTSLLVRHIKLEYYLFSRQILQLIRNMRLHKQNINICYHPQPAKIIHELSKFIQFLQNFYQKKCLKQIQIIEDNIVQREEAIRYSTPIDRYKTITKSFRPVLITNNIDIMEEFKQMSIEGGSFNELSKVQCSLYKKLRQTEGKISKVFTAVCDMKEKDQFMFKIDDL